MQDDRRFPPRVKPFPPPQAAPRLKYNGPITIVCVLRPSADYSALDADKLYRAVARNLERDFRFVCLTELSQNSFDENIKTVALEHPEWETKHSKLEMFRPYLLESWGRVLYLDLDTIILGSLEDIASYDGTFCMLDDFFMSPALGSGLMAWGPEIGSEIYFDFIATSVETRNTVYKIGGGRGDQLFIRHHTTTDPHLFQKLWPGQVISYKAHLRNDLCQGWADQAPASMKEYNPRVARVVCFHGRPKIGEITEKWLLNYWK